MRRQDREVTDSQKIDNIILSCNCIRLGFVDEGRAYIVPLNFGFIHQDNKRVFYFHSAKAGRKVDLINETYYAAFEMDTSYALHEGKIACECTSFFESVMGEGSISIINDRDEKISALNMLMKTTTKKETNFVYSDKMLDEVFVFKLEVETISCKVKSIGM